ncbi:MAG TPA: ABC transporter ATP-binding protein [Firmicutes bacterium]|nr:ABC transporter ATP-binding protein [Bacillota bacterium]
MREFKKLTIQNLTKKFGEKEALTDFNLTVEKGQFVTFLGPSGCGKSTALNCIAGLLPITSGQIYINEECIDNGIKKVPVEKRGFGMVFQNYALFPHLTVFNNVAFGLELKRISKNEIKEKVLNILKMVHLEGYENKFPSQMSGGEQQRVAIARCIVLEPDLLMLDEPLSNLDAKLRNDMRYELKTLHERLQVASIYVTHDQQEALALSDKIVVMKKGYIQQVGTPEEIYSHPANLFVADFMGFRNIWEAQIEEIDDSNDEAKIVVDINGHKLISHTKFTNQNRRLKPALQQAFKNHQTINTAIRPEDFLIGKGETNNLKCKVGIVEYLGQISHITGTLNNNSQADFRASEKIRIGDELDLWIPPEKLLVFPKGVNTYV